MCDDDDGRDVDGDESSQRQTDPPNISLLVYTYGTAMWTIEKKTKQRIISLIFGFASSLGGYYVSDGGRHPPYSSTCGWTFGFNEVKYNKKSRPPDWLSPAAIFSRRGLQSKHHKTGSSSSDNNPVALLFSFRSILLVSFFLLIIIIFIISKEEEEDGEL